MRRAAEAARRLGVSQPSLTARLRRLEDRLGARLFERDRAGVAPTAAGAAFLDGARAALEASEGAGRAAREAQAGWGQGLAIGMTQLAAYGIVPRALAAFRAAQPLARVSLREASTAALEAMLEARRIDAAFLHPPITAPGLTERVLGEAGTRLTQLGGTGAAEALVLYRREEAPATVAAMERAAADGVAPAPGGAEAVTVLGALTLSLAGYGAAGFPEGYAHPALEGAETHPGPLRQQTSLAWRALDEATKKIGEAGLSGEIGDEEKSEIGQLVARAALRFADLQNQRTTNYVFDLERFTSFEGKTGPYLLYAAVRMKALLRRAEAEGHKPGAVRIESDVERRLALTLDGFALALRLAKEKRMPHYVCEHVYTLAQAFSAFYAASPILKEGVSAEDRASRLGIVEAVLNQLEDGLGILGITAPERMKDRLA